MASRPAHSPTQEELRILSVLWARGPSTVRQVNEELNQQRPTGYTTTLKLLQIMRDKGIVRRDESTHSHVYRAATPQVHTQRRLLNELVERVYEGSVARLVAQALSSSRVSKEELEEVRQLIERMKDKPS